MKSVIDTYIARLSAAKRNFDAALHGMKAQKNPVYVVNGEPERRKAIVLGALPKDRVIDYTLLGIYLEKKPGAQVILSSDAMISMLTVASSNILEGQLEINDLCVKVRELREELAETRKRVALLEILLRNEKTKNRKAEKELR